ncbi:primosome assembly protein PriA [Sphingobium sp. TomMM35A]
MKYAASPFEIKSLNDTGRIEGLLSGFNNIDSYGDVVRPGAFTKSLAARSGRPLPMLLHHDMTKPVGVWSEAKETSEGLFVKGRFTLEVRDAQEAHALATAGAITGLSIGYREKKGNPITTTGGRELIEVDLLEGSLVTIPANPITHVTDVKGISGARDIEDMLREGGLSHRQAKAAASAAWKAINTSNDDDEAEAQAQAIFNASAARIRAIGGKRP